MQVVAHGQVQRSAAEWQGILARYRQSGLGMKECCGQEGLRLRTVEEWDRRLRRSETPQGHHPPGPPLRGPGAIQPVPTRPRGVPNGELLARGL